MGYLTTDENRIYLGKTQVFSTFLCDFVDNYGFDFQNTLKLTLQMSISH